MPRARAICCVPNCPKPRSVVGRCYQHRTELQTTDPQEYARLVMLSGEDADHAFYMTKHGLPLPPWTYEGNEEALIKICDQHSRQHVQVGASAGRSEMEIDNG
jgi:hypothetical protein